MNWDEVSRINSDLMVPLDERMKYINGILPRGIASKNVSKTVKLSSFSGEVLNVSGSGVVMGATCSCESYNRTYARISIDIDNGEKIITVGDTVQRTSGINTSFAFDIDSSTSDFSESDNVLDVPTNSKKTINFPIKYKKSLVVTMDIYSEKSNNVGSASSATFNYGIY